MGLMERIADEQQLNEIDQVLRCRVIRLSASRGRAKVGDGRLNG